MLLTETTSLQHIPVNLPSNNRPSYIIHLTEICSSCYHKPWSQGRDTATVRLKQNFLHNWIHGSSRLCRTKGTHLGHGSWEWDESYSSVPASTLPLWPILADLLLSWVSLPDQRLILLNRKFKILLCLVVGSGVDLFPTWFMCLATTDCMWPGSVFLCDPENLKPVCRSGLFIHCSNTINFTEVTPNRLHHDAIQRRNKSCPSCSSIGSLQKWHLFVKYFTNNQNMKAHMSTLWHKTFSIPISG